MNFFYYLFGSLLLNYPAPDFYNTKAIEYRNKIAVIDTGIEVNEKTKKYLCYGKHYDITGKGIEDWHGHGTNIAGIIAKQIDTNQFCLLIIKYYHFSGSAETEVKGLKIALKEKATHVNFSSGGDRTDFLEKQIIEKLLKHKIYFITASGNWNTKLEKGNCNYYPSCYNFQSQYFRVIGNGVSEDKKHKFSNYGPVVTDWRDGKDVEGFGIIMSGSSQSAAIMTRELVGKK